ncbi:uncharacterized protein LOC111709845 [Eurytemora carolleeae]|uniref:uncharacterized protein LOC111709845 n=1 Tax=Eurytemora carolleeae TaxID=1294199 RepID=UPI000C78F5CD|nr:uncharacterized protein LOC111709845 [Eurytemora carolleeae]XP_023339529.1 uncharacterized protein LOC111709845 [Eurytemora carolleeae]|eukprot:XP_023339528.1 uncharacterized protein LOC111709845 [Eurytemora affinis]
MKCLNMGSYCSQLSSPRKNSILPPPDLSTLLNNYEKESQDSTYWLEKFKSSLISMDERTDQIWRTQLLEFVLVCRSALQQGLDNQDTLNSLKEYLEEGGVSVSDLELREDLFQSLESYISKSSGARGTRAALSGSPPSSAKVLENLKLVLLDPSVWKTLENEYSRFLKQTPSPPKLAVILSIL